MLNLKKQSFSNHWFVDGKEVANIIIYDATGVLLDTQRAWMPVNEHNYNAFDGFPDVHEIVNRNKVRFDRLEHFFCKGVLYINASMFNGYSTVAHRREIVDTARCQTAVRSDIGLTFSDGREWIVTESRYRDYQNTRLGEQADAVREIFNKRVADHTNRHLSQWQAARLIEALPELMEAVQAK